MTYGIREFETGYLWRCPEATRRECAMTARLWLSWGIRCVVVPVGDNEPRLSNGGYARAAKLSPGRRAEIARSAALARWSK